MTGNVHSYGEDYYTKLAAEKILIPCVTGRKYFSIRPK